MNEEQAYCACLHVNYDPEEVSGGKMRERWLCADCGMEFVKQPILNTNRAENADFEANRKKRKEDRMKKDCIVLNKKQQKLHDMIVSAEKALTIARLNASDLKCECAGQHFIAQSHSSAECAICGQDFGWYCPKSPDHCCHYYSEENKVRLVNGKMYPLPKRHDNKNESDDWCIFCREPDERK